jgi:hypothetical protein
MFAQPLFHPLRRCAGQVSGTGFFGGLYNRAGRLFLLGGAAMQGQGHHGKSEAEERSFPLQLVYL